MRRGQYSVEQIVGILKQYENGRFQLHGVRLNAPDRSRESHSFSVTVRSRRRVGTIHAMFNAYWEPLVFELPPVIPGHPPWRRWIDTYRDAPDDIHDPPIGPPVQGPTYTVQARSIVTLFAEGTGATSGGRSVPQRRTTR